MNAGQLYNYHSVRARQARLARRLSGVSLYWILVLTGLVVCVAGLCLLTFLHNPFGWLIAGMAGPLWVMAGYGRGLRQIVPLPRSQTVDGLLEAELLAQLPLNPSPEQILHAALHTASGQFVVERCQLMPLLATVSNRSEDSEAVWQRALAISTQVAEDNLSGASVVAALALSLPHATRGLAAVKLDESSLVDAVRWRQQIVRFVAQAHQRQHTGGLARDWSFGFTPLLARFGDNLSTHPSKWWRADIPSHQQLLEQIMQGLSQGGRRNVALVGQLGAGKTTVVHALAQRLLTPNKTVPAELHFRQIIALQPSVLIAQASNKGELEEVVDRLAQEALKAKNIILFLDDAELFFEDGSGAVNLSHILFPYLENGGLKLVLAMDEQRWLRIAQANPALAQLLHRLTVPPMDRAETLLAIQDRLPVFEYQHHVTYTYQALEAAYRLSDRYLNDQAMPGKAIAIIEAAAGYANPDDKLVTEQSVTQAIEQTQGVHVAVANEDSERQTLLNLEELIHRRMINQTRAVQVVSDALRRARAGVRNTNRPIGTFLFLGPTGVGKTELAKSVAAVFFGGEDRLIRLDMNEYVRPEDVARLIADASQDPHSLAAHIARNPFSVVLLDEIEKAHPDVLGTLLQMLDEGILRDNANRPVNFRDAVIIATSNAGAERIREHIQKGEQLEQFESSFIEELISSNLFRPEFLNRFDEIVLFRPLSPDELMQVVDIILASVNNTLAAQKVSVTVDQTAKKLLVQAGYDPRLGARPLRRVVQRVVENIVANQLLAKQVEPGGQVQIGASDVEAMLKRE